MRRILQESKSEKCPFSPVLSKKVGFNPRITSRCAAEFTTLSGLRLYPPVPLNNRQATKTTVLPTGGGPDGKQPILVRKGEMVVFSQYVSSRFKSLYGPDADVFRPERWEGDELAQIGWAYYPFNGGPRQCLGEDFALMEVSYTVVRLLQACDSITLPEGDANEPVGTEKQRLTLVLASADGCRVNCVRRDKGL